MAMIQLPIPDINRTVLRPLVLGIVRDLVSRSYIGPDTQIRYPGPLGSLIQPKSTIGQDDGDRTKFGAQPSIDLEVTERLLEEEVSVNNVYKNNNAPVFIDDKLGVFIRPETAFHEIQITMRIRHPDLLNAERWRDDMRYRLRSGKIVHQHSTKWYKHFDPVMFLLLKEIHRLRENVDGYGDTFQDYIQDCFDQKTQLLTTMEAASADEEQKNAIVHTDSITNIRGWFEFPVTPENAQKQENNKSFETTVNYIVQYDKPTNWMMLYPISVHNQLLSKNWRRSAMPGDEAKTIPIRSDMNHYLEHFRSGRGVHEKYSAQDAIAIPSFDDWLPDLQVTKTRPLWNALTQLEQEAPGGLLVDLMDMGKYKFSYTMLQFLKGEVPFIHRRFRSVFQIYLYEGGRLLPSERYLRMDDDLKIYCTQELDFRKVYHLQFAVVTDLELLDEDAIDRIIAFPPRDEDGNVLDPNIKDWPDIIFDTVYPGIHTCWDIKNLPTKRDIQQFMWTLANHGKGVQNHLITCKNIKDPNHQRDDELVKPRTYSIFEVNVHRIDP